MAVTGIGGIFFRSEDPGSLQEWYGKHFGIAFDGSEPWMQSAGPTVFMPFAKNTDHFPADKQWMINLRVTGMTQLLEALRDAGVDVITDPDWNTPETGTFARVYDPEGNAVELWEPPAA
jgi:predicted enzyme related to lactoylglutathione lyase